MRKTISLLIIFSAITIGVYAQTDDSNITKKPENNTNKALSSSKGCLSKGGLSIGKFINSDAKSIDGIINNIYYGVNYKGTFGSVVIPINFNYLIVKDDSVSVGPSINIGVGYTWMNGSFYIGKDDNLNLNYNFVYGLAFNASYQNKNEITKYPVSALVGGFFGFKSISLYGGYDVLNKSGKFGLGTSININSLSNNALSIWSKELKPIFVPANAEKIPDDNLKEIAKYFE